MFNACISNKNSKFKIHNSKLLTRRAYSIIIFAALIYNLCSKFLCAYRTDLTGEYYRWIFSDILVLLSIEVILALICLHWPRRWVIRIVTLFAALICTWSVMNAGWLIRTGTQILPTVLLPLFRSPVNSLSIIGVSLVKMPLAAVILLGPSAVLLIFFFCVLIKPKLPDYNPKRFTNRLIFSSIIILLATVGYAASARQGSSQMASVALRYNCHLKALVSLISFDAGRLAKIDFANAERKIPAFDEIEIAPPPQAKRINYNIVIVVLEGIQYGYTSLADKKSNLTPYLATCARQGIEFKNARSTLTHTTKALFSLLTGRVPSVSQDIIEAVPAAKPYAGLATILKQNLNFRTAFFQSAKGNFECRPGLVYNLGFDKFWAREDLNDPNAFLGYLACDEFSMLEPIVKWIRSETGPFLLTIMCSVSHDPYEVPDWFAEPAAEPLERYKQAIFYTDSFIAALDTELAKLNLTDKTIFCIVGDHGEAFGEHGMLGHERIAFEEVLRIPLVIRSPSPVEPAAEITEPVSSIDLTPTLLSLLNFDLRAADFDGIDATGSARYDRRVYFSGWLQQSPAGFVEADRKFVYSPIDKTVFVYDLGSDPLELAGIELDEQQAKEISEKISCWRKNSIFRNSRQQMGETTLFDHWFCRWTKRLSWAKDLSE